MKRRYRTITILTALLFLTALAGYLIPAKSDGPPVRILLQNKAGKIIFTHADHMDSLDRECAKCHHTSGNSQTPPPCRSCHVGKFDDAFITEHQDSIAENQCVTCHHPQASIANFSHEDHVNDYGGDDCQLCHHTKDIEPEPQSCANCHENPTDKAIPGMRKANHSRCALCHQDFYDEGLEGCQHCHVREMAPPAAPDTQACTDCHTEPLDQLIPTTTAAFHGKCMGCHEAEGTGPFGDDACYQCHMK